LIEVDRGHFRLVAWIATTFLLMFTIYSNQVITLTSGLGDLLSQTLGTILPALPFFALLLVLTAFRWKDFHEVLLTERGLTSKPAIRLAGVLLILLPATLWALFFGSGGPSTYLAMELSASSLVLVAYGALLVVNPTMWRIMLPYASLYAVGLLAPLIMLDLLGDPLAAFCSYIAAQITNVLGIHVVWEGVAFGFISLTGEPVSSVVSSVCSAAYSISIYLGLLGLMYLDMRKSPVTTAKFLVAGVMVLPFLNSARIALTILVGYLYGSAAFWWLHDWLGYAVFLAFYIVVLVVYSRTGKPRITRDPASSSVGSSSPPLSHR
jgi:exosortase/archaeosortase family protein